MDRLVLIDYCIEPNCFHINHTADVNVGISLDQHVAE